MNISFCVQVGIIFLVSGVLGIIIAKVNRNMRVMGTYGGILLCLSLLWLSFAAVDYLKPRTLYYYSTEYDLDAFRDRLEQADIPLETEHIVNDQTEYIENEHSVIWGDRYTYYVADLTPSPTPDGYVNADEYRLIGN